MKNLLQDLGNTALGAIRETVQGHEAETVNMVIKECILKTTLALLEADVNESKISELLIKYWDMRPSEANHFLQEANAYLNK